MCKKLAVEMLNGYMDFSMYGTVWVGGCWVGKAACKKCLPCRELLRLQEILEHIMAC